MTRVFIFFFYLIAISTLVAGRSPKPKPPSFVLPVIKDSSTGLHYTTLTIGKPQKVVNLALDVRGPVSWIYCYNVGYNSTTYTPIPCGSSRCKQKTKNKCSVCHGTYSPYCRKNQCSDHFDSPFGYSSIPTRLLDDNVMIRHTSAHDGFYTGNASPLAVRLPLSCASANHDDILRLLPVGSHGILGLGNSSLSLVNTLVSTYKIPFKVALCLPSRNISSQVGAVYIGGGPYALPHASVDISSFLSVVTPLIRIPEKRKYLAVKDYKSAEDSYYIRVKSIEVNFKKLSLNESLLTSGTKISTTTRYTILQTSIYKAVVKAFGGIAKKVKAVKPFQDCYKSKSFDGNSLLKAKDALIMLNLEGGATWEINGPNAVVKVNEDVVCLAFVDGGENLKTSIVMGAHQLENVLAEFDLETSMFSITPSLLLFNSACRRI